MMGFRVVLVACAALACGLTGAAARDPTVLTPAQTKALVDKAAQRSMVFFVAKGEENACGPGCSEWIAAEGDIDAQAHKRFDNFVEKLPRRDLPIFFNSIGGQTKPASFIAVTLRKNRMRVGVARTAPEGCRADVVSDAACRGLVQSKTEIKARLVTKDAKCNSACGIAFAGGSVRQVAADAQFGIHSWAMMGKAKVDEWNAEHKRFFVALGVDPGFIDLNNSIPHNRPRPMSRAEITRVGVETRGFFETHWLLDRKPSPNLMEQLSIRKGITQEDNDRRGEYRAAQLIVLCSSVREPHLFYRREMWKSENSGGVSISLGGSTLQLVRLQADEKDVDARHVKVSYDLLRKAAAEPAIEITGLFYADAEFRPRVAKISTAGLSSGLDEFTKHCVGSKPIVTPEHAVAR